METEVQYGDHVFVKDGEKIVRVQYLDKGRAPRRIRRGRTRLWISNLLLALSVGLVFYGLNGLGHNLFDEESIYLAGSEVYHRKTGYMIAYYPYGAKPVYQTVYGKVKIVVDPTLTGSDPVRVRIQKCHWLFGSDDHVQIQVVSPSLIRKWVPYQKRLDLKRTDHEI